LDALVSVHGSGTWISECSDRRVARRRDECDSHGWQVGYRTGCIHLQPGDVGVSARRCLTNSPLGVRAVDIRLERRYVELRIDPIVASRFQYLAPIQLERLRDD